MSHPVLARPVPASYSELYTTHYSYITKLVQKAGIDAQNVDDISMWLLTRFYERDVLSDYDPTHTTAHGGVVREANFDTFLSGFVFSYIRYIKGRQELQKVREPTLVDDTVSVSDRGEISWGEAFSPSHIDKHENLDLDDLVSRIHIQLADTQQKKSRSSCDLPLFFDAVKAQVEETGKVNVEELAELFSITRTSIQNWMTRLRSQITHVLEAA